MKFLFGLMVICLLASGLTLPYAADAADVYTPIQYKAGWEIIPAECLSPTGYATRTLENGRTVELKCDPNSFVQLFVNLAGIILKILPTLAMLVIFYGGFRFIIAAGNPNAISEGKKVLVSAVTGIVIVIILAWFITFAIVKAVTGTETGRIFGSVLWWNPDETGNQDQQPVESGCCYVPNVGAQNSNQNACDVYRAAYNVENSSYTAGQLCSTLAPAQNLLTTFRNSIQNNSGCCISVQSDGSTMKDSNSNGFPDECYPLTPTGCFGHSGTGYTPNSCAVWNNGNCS